VYRIDITFPDTLVAVDTQFFLILFVVAAMESAYRCSVDCAELASGIIIIENVFGWEFSVFPLAVHTFYHVYTIFSSIVESVYITHVFSFVRL
jgi:hypothetical protein